MNDRIANLGISITDWNAEHPDHPVTVVCVPMRPQSKYTGPLIVGASIIPEAMAEAFGPDQASWPQTLFGLPVMVLP